MAIPHSRGGNELTKFTLSGLELNIQSSPTTFVERRSNTYVSPIQNAGFPILNRAMRGKGSINHKRVTEREWNLDIYN
ncbi:MAG TPA: hypothetical protein VEG65_05065 [Candidatus Bathyarchaeia archaeon]|nr:hypothetical protein [Candidatus Bathyarchaeia archaeon]